MAKVASVETAARQHSTAVGLAARVQACDAPVQLQRIAEWYRDCAAIRRAWLAAQRSFKSKVRLRTKQADPCVEIAQAVIRETRVSFDRAALEKIAKETRGAFLERLVRRARKDMAAVDFAQLDAKHRWLFAVEFYAAVLGRRADEFLSLAGLVASHAGTGKQNGPLHVAALALATLGHKATDIQRALGVNDTAYVRRITRDARVS